MTYCVGMLVKGGLVMIADTRTNAGVDDISAYRKLHLIEVPGERLIAVATAGSLSVTQTALSLLAEGVVDPETHLTETLVSAPTMLRAVQLVGAAVQKVRGDLAGVANRENVSTEVSLLVGGQIVGQPMRLFLVYSAGNFIECGEDTPFLQIGEHKYGKPILDRALDYGCDPLDALKLGLLSMDATLRSNLAVGLPLDIVLLRRDAITPETRARIPEDDVYFHALGDQWSAALKKAHRSIPRPSYP